MRWAGYSASAHLLTLLGVLLLQGPVLTLLLDVAAGMSYLHSRNVLHVSGHSCFMTSPCESTLHGIVWS
jgi:hypothetical protein